MNLFLIYILIINLITILVFSLDKLFSKKDKFRISEFKLHLLEVLGGIFSIIFFFHIIKHKRRKVSYYFISYLILFIWVLVLINYKI